MLFDRLSFWAGWQPPEVVFDKDSGSGHFAPTLPSVKTTRHFQCVGKYSQWDFIEEAKKLAMRVYVCDDERNCCIWISKDGGLTSYLNVQRLLSVAFNWNLRSKCCIIKWHGRIQEDELKLVIRTCNKFKHKRLSPQFQLDLSLTVARIQVLNLSACAAVWSNIQDNQCLRFCFGSNRSTVRVKVNSIQAPSSHSLMRSRVTLDWLGWDLEA